MNKPRINRIDTTGPFGLWMGMDGSQVGADLDQLRPFWFHAECVPEPLPGIYSYCLSIAPRAGLSLIETGSFPITTSASGAELWSAFTAMQAALAQTYGDHHTIKGGPDGQPPGAPDRWLQALRRGEQPLRAQWSTADRAPLAHGLASVTLKASVSGSPAHPHGYLAMQFTFLNYTAAMAEIASWRIVGDDDEDEDF